MSSFKDTFTRNQDENVLGYDDSASLYFITSFLICLTSIWSIFFFWNLLKNKVYTSSDKLCLCTVCSQRRSAQNRWANRLKSITKDISRGLQLFILIILWCVIVRCCIALRSAQTLTMFDPFEILEISRSASVRDIKRAFRTLSLKMHPDKNPDDVDAAARFILISKAYEALTDEVGKANYAKYGNPDGAGPMKIGIGLPKLFMNKKYQLGILLAIFTILLVIIPSIFLVYYNKQKQYAGNGVLIDTMVYLMGALKESTRAKAFPDLLASSMECEECTELRETDNEEMKMVVQDVTQYVKRQLRANHTPLTLRNHYLILAHLQRMHHILTPHLQDQLDKILKHTNKVVYSFIEYSLYRKWLYAAQAAIEFSRCLYQAMEPGSNTLLQLPHFTEERVKHCLRGKKPIRDLNAFIRKSKEERKGVLDLTPMQLVDIEAFIDAYPRISLTLKISVNNESIFYDGDHVEVAVLLNREHLGPKETCGVSHAPSFPEQRHEHWWLVLCEKNSSEVLDFSLCVDRAKTVVEKLHLRAVEGKKTYTLSAYCTTFAGCDVSDDFVISALPRTQEIDKIFIHEEDQKLDLQPNFFSQVLGGPQFMPKDEDDENETMSASGISDSSE